MFSFRPTYLYVKTHNITGLNYFGKTIKDPLKYKGSGKRWLNHIQKHGYDVTTKIIGYYTIEQECINSALQFSQQNNIVESPDWANLMPENGINGGLQYNSGENFRIINSKPRTKEHTNKISKGMTGKKNKSIPATVKGIYFNSMAEAAKYFNVCEGSIYYWIKTGNGKRHK